MDDGYGVISIKSIKQLEKIDDKSSKKIEAVLAMANHVKRGLQGVLGAKPHIDPTRTFENYALHGLDDPESIKRHVFSQIALAGIKLQKNHVMLISVVFSLPKKWHEKEIKAYFSDCYKWALKAFDCEMITFDCHFDESSPHAHALFLPIITDNKTGKQKMGGSYIMGDGPMFKNRLNSFYQDVAGKYGLKRGKKLSASDKEQMAKTLLSHAERAKDPMFKSAYFQTIRDLLYEYPERFASEIGCEFKGATNQTKAKTFVDHKRSKGKGKFIK